MSFLLLGWPVEKTESQESLLPSQFCSFILLRFPISWIIQFTINQLIVFIILENIIEYQPCVLFYYPVEKTESQESLLPSQFCSFLRLAAKNNSHHFHKEDSFFSVGPSFFLITGEPEAGGPGGGSWAYHILQIYTGKFLSEALILAATNSQYDKRLFTEIRVQYMKTTSSEHVVFFVFLLT